MIQAILLYGYLFSRTRFFFLAPDVSDPTLGNYHTHILQYYSVSCVFYIIQTQIPNFKQSSASTTLYSFLSSGRFLRKAKFSNTTLHFLLPG